MVRRFFIFFVLWGGSWLSQSASVSNLELINVEPKQNLDKKTYLDEVKLRTTLPTNKSNSAQQANNQFQPLNFKTFGIPGFINRTSFFEVNSDQEANPYKITENIVVWLDIKTSLKVMNAELNGIDDWLNNFFAKEPGTLKLSDLSTKNVVLLSESYKKTENSETESVSLEQLAALKNAAKLNDSMDDQPFISQFLHFFKLPHLIELITNNIPILIAIFFLWIFAKLGLKFLQWKAAKKQRQNSEEKNRTIDGISKN
jgi:hypothetical protein